MFQPSRSSSKRALLFKKVPGTLCMLFALLQGWAFAADNSLDAQARAIADQLRCPVCRGIPIAESPSELAQDMMQVIRQKLVEGKTEAEILDYFEDRYGEWILLKPKPKGLNLLVWILPILFLIGGGFFLAFKISHWSHPKT